MRIEYAKISLTGDRHDNQDRVAVIVSDRAALLLVFDGMGGHADGALAAQTALESMRRDFGVTAQPVFDPQGFLYLSLGRAHARVAELGAGVEPGQRPRATGAVCLVQDGAAWWGHVGDSRVYHVRNGAVARRTRDHSHVEVLLREGLIREPEVQSHPMRNFVESCLGGDVVLPGLSVTSRRALQSGDVLLACTDGLWSGVDEAELAALAGRADRPVMENLRELGDRALRANAPHSDNTTAAAVRWTAG